MFANEEESIYDVGARIVTNSRIRSEQTQIGNWLLLTTALNRCEQTVSIVENEAIHVELRRNAQVTIGQLLALPGLDPGIMLGAIARAIQIGTVICETRTKPLTRNSVLTLSGRPA